MTYQNENESNSNKLNYCRKVKRDQSLTSTTLRGQIMVFQPPPRVWLNSCACSVTMSKAGRILADRQWSIAGNEKTILEAYYHLISMAMD